MRTAIKRAVAGRTNAKEVWEVAPPRPLSAKVQAMEVRSFGAFLYGYMLCCEAEISISRT